MRKDKKVKDEEQVKNNDKREEQEGKIKHKIVKKSRQVQVSKGMRERVSS